MSQVVKAITATDTGNRKILSDGFSPLFQDVFSSKATIREDKYSDIIAKEYRIGVTIGANAWIEDNFYGYSYGDLIKESIDRTKRHVIEAIFGEFRTDFMMIERALYDRDFQKARDYLRQFEDKMFSEKD